MQTQEIVGATVTALIVEVPHLEAYEGATNAREIENFLYGFKRYFDVLGIMGDDARLRTVLIYFKDSALIWWGQSTMMDAFKIEINNKFDPTNAEYEAQARVHYLQYKDKYMKSLSTSSPTCC